MIFSVLLWRYAHVFSERADKVRIIVVAERCGDVLYRLVCCYQRKFGKFEFALGYELVGCLAGVLSERAEEMPLRHASHAGKMVEIYGLTDVFADVGKRLLNAIVLDLALCTRQSEKARQKDYHDAVRLNFFVKRALLILQIIVYESLMIVVGVRVGCRNLQLRIYIAQPLNQFEVAGLSLDLYGHFQVLQNGWLVLYIFENMNVVMYEMRIAEAVVYRVCRNHVKMMRREPESARRQFNFGCALGNVIEAEEGTSHICPVPVAVVVAASGVEGKQVKPFDRNIHFFCLFVKTSAKKQKKTKY